MRTRRSRTPLWLVAVVLATCALPGGGHGQQQTVAGRVLSAAENGPVAGAIVQVAGSGVRVLSDQAGAFTVQVPTLEATLLVSAVGFSADTVALNGQRVVTVLLRAEAVQLEGVVAVGYGTQRRRDVAGAITSVAAEQLEQQSVPSVVQALQGRAAGVQIVQNNGAPGVSATVRIRGGNSYLGGNDPLYVIDGLPVPGNPLGTLNPSDVASIEVLKDASATAIYGARGANGVVLVTTKAGRAGGNRLDFEVYTGIQRVARKMDLLNAREFAELSNERSRNDRVALAFPDPNNLPADTDWQEAIFRDAPIQNYALTFSGGSAETRYFLSGRLLDQEGVIEKSEFNQGSLRFNFDQEISSRFRISTRLNGSRTRNDVVATDGAGSVVFQALGAPPVVPIFDANGNYSDVTPFYFSTATQENPVAVMRDPLDRRKNLQLLGHASGEFDLWEGLTAKALFGAEHANSEQDQYTPRTIRSGLPSGFGSETRAENTTYINENTITLEREVGEHHRINAIAGATYQTNQSSSTRISSRGFVTDDLRSANLAAGETVLPPLTNGSEWTLASYLGRVNYALMDRYIVTVSGRYDGSSRFGANYKWGFFPSAALAWRISDEPIMGGVDWLSDLKLRGSWGRTGNQEIALYQSLARIASEPAVFGGTPTVAFAPANIPNYDLKWETTEQVDLGFDLGIWDQRLRLSGDVYRKNTSDLLALVELPPSTGYPSSIQNIGAIRNTGFELSLGGDVITGENLTWTLDGNFSANRNVVTRTAKGVDVFAPSIGLVGSATIIREGEPLGAFYGFLEDGLTAAGAINYVDNNADGTITNADRVVMGDPYPDFTYGLNSTIRYGPLELNAFLQGVEGMQVFNFNQFYFANSFNRGFNQVRDVLDYWTPQNLEAKYPKVSAVTDFRVSDRFVEDASYLRLKNARLAYQVPGGLAQRARARDAVIYVSATNLFTWTDYSWFDPEVSSYGGDSSRFAIDFTAYPQARTYTLGMRFGL